jgi:hypothetical protein
MKTEKYKKHLVSKALSLIWKTTINFHLFLLKRSKKIFSFKIKNWIKMS